MRSRVSHRVRAHIQRWPTLSFLIPFFILNCLLFLPLFLLNIEETRFLPGTAGDLWQTLPQLFISRENYDIFRLNLEFLILVTAWVTIHQLRRRAFRSLLIAIYFVALAYAIYEGITLSIWQAEPVFYTHYFMALDGIEFLMGHLHLSALIYVGVGILLIGIVAVIYGLLRVMTAAGEVSTPGRGTRRGLVALSFLAIAIALTAPTSIAASASAKDETRLATLASPTMVVSSLSIKLSENIERSRDLYASTRVSHADEIDEMYDFSQYHLAEKPNIYLIFVESYGSVLYKRDDYRLAYESLLHELEPQLEEAGLSATTALSESPTWGGGSWMAYTSALFGLRIEEHPSYLALVDAYQERNYPDLGNYLKSQGYHYSRVSSLATELKEEVWVLYKNFFGVDAWLEYGDLGYVGERYGWGPAPPDQYVLNYADIAGKEATDSPRLLFFITQNSHYPWMPLPELADDWQSLNVPAPDQEAIPDDELEHATRRRNYFNAIEYELRFLTDFIIQHEDENAIFVLVGDHQPPRVSRRADGWDTPMHIISRDAEFVAGFSEYGFVDGLLVDEIVPTVHHEGFYTMFLRELLANYGVRPEDRSPYFPDGLMLNEIDEDSVPQE